MKLSKRIIQLLLAPQLQDIALADWVQIIRVLRYQQCLGRLAWLLRQQGLFEQLPDYAKNHLSNAEIIANKQRLQVHYEARLLHDTFASSSPYLLFLKGAAYSLQQNADVANGRTYSDIDLLVPRDQLTAIEQQLSLKGFLSEALEEYDQQYYRQWAHEIPPLRHCSRGTILDVHHNLVPPISGRAPDIQLFLHHSAQTEAGFQVFNPAAMFLHSSIHLFLNEEIKHGFRDLSDLWLLAKQYQSAEFWQQLVELAKQAGFSTELALALRYLQQIFQFVAPLDIQQQLNSAQPGLFKARLLDFMFVRQLSPYHPKLADFSHTLAATGIFVRGHWLKMPLHILLLHSWHKLWKNSVSALFGSTFWDKKAE